jgi:imidazole glycerol-phosphate synthase subunit HisH
MSHSTIAILDYGIGNIRSISNAVEALGETPLLTRKPKEILDAKALIFPGVGAFSKGMANLHELDLVPVIYDYVATGKAFLGICLGMQMLFEWSEEFGLTRGLGLIPGKVIRMPLSAEENLKLPHISWNSILEPEPGKWDDTILTGITPAEEAYFVHSFVGVPSDSQNLLSVTNYGNHSFCSAVRNENIYGVQFHPEKSRNTGLHILRNFTNLTTKKH